MSSVARAVSWAKSLTSDATTAKPLPASPARAASMVAFRASRLVCSAIEVISLITLPISAEDSPSCRTVSVARAASSTATAAICAASLVFCEISRIDRPISSEPAATVCTFRAISSASADAAEVCELLLSAASAISPATVESCVAAPARATDSVSIVRSESRIDSIARSSPAAIRPSSSRVVMLLRCMSEPLTSYPKFTSSSAMPLQSMAFAATAASPRALTRESIALMKISVFAIDSWVAPPT